MRTEKQTHTPSSKIHSLLRSGGVHTITLTALLSGSPPLSLTCRNDDQLRLERLQGREDTLGVRLAEPAGAFPVLHADVHDIALHPRDVIVPGAGVKLGTLRQHETKRVGQSRGEARRREAKSAMKKQTREEYRQIDKNTAVAVPLRTCLPLRGGGGAQRGGIRGRRAVVAKSVLLNGLPS